MSEPDALQAWRATLERWAAKAIDDWMSALGEGLPRGAMVCGVMVVDTGHGLSVELQPLMDERDPSDAIEAARSALSIALEASMFGHEIPT